MGAGPRFERRPTPYADARRTRRLVSLGAEGVGGIVEAGEQGAWVERRIPLRRLDALKKGERWPWSRGLTLVRDVARALAACEREGLFPGALRPSDLVIASDDPDPSAWIEASGLVAALLGESPPRRDPPGLRWTPPEQAAGAPWDHAANRYVLGLVAYRVLAGEHPFGGAGMRHALAEQRGEIAPFEEDVARSIQPGVQGFVLGMLDPSPAGRPPSARDVMQRCEALLAGEETPSLPASPAPSPATPLAPIHPSTPSRRLLLTLVPPLAGTLLAALIFATPSRTRDTPRPRPARLTTARARDCAPCHSREVAEWERSVMANAVTSPLFGALESVVEEQVGRETSCPNGAGALRKAGADVCRDPRTGITVTGAGGEHWCVNCHAPAESLASSLPPWGAHAGESTRAPVRDLVSAAGGEGISCAACHETVGPVSVHGSGRGYEGNPTWTSIESGAVFLTRPEDARGLPGIANSGYKLDPGAFLAGADRRPGRVHGAPSPRTARYLASSELCGACHDVRLFGSDAVAAPSRGEHFKRLRDAYSEWRGWADAEERAGRTASSCADCHMSLYPGRCVPGGNGDADCPAGTHFEAAPPGTFPSGRVAAGSAEATRVSSHYFTSVDLPLAASYPDSFADDRTLDPNGLPVGLRGRRDTLLRHTFSFAVVGARRQNGTLEVPVRITNTGAGHRVPAGFSQEREIWVEMTVRDGRGAVVYEVGKLSAPDEDLRDKVFLRVNIGESVSDRRGRPRGVFGADITDGPDVPRWSPDPAEGGTTFRGRGLVNFQNGFLRCVRCLGVVDGDGRCQPGPGQGLTRADRFADGEYDPDTGACGSNLGGGAELFETYFPVGALDASRGIAKAPDAIISTRSAPPGVPRTYTYVLDVGARPPPFTVEAKLHFRAFPPFLVRAFADYEARRAAEGGRPGGAQVTAGMLGRLEVLEIASARAKVE